MHQHVTAVLGADGKRRVARQAHDVRHRLARRRKIIHVRVAAGQQCVAIRLHNNGVAGRGSVAQRDSWRPTRQRCDDGCAAAGVAKRRQVVVRTCHVSNNQKTKLSPNAPRHAAEVADAVKGNGAIGLDEEQQVRPRQLGVVR